MPVPTLYDSNSGSEARDATAHTVNLPASVVAGQLLVVWMSFDGSPSVTWDNTSHGTWTAYVDTANGTSCKLYIAAKVADGTEGGGMLSIGTGASEQSAHRAVAYQGWHGTLRGGLNIPAAATGTTNTPTPPAATDSWGAVERGTIAIEGCDGARTVSAYPRGYALNHLSIASGGVDGCGLGSAKRDGTEGAQTPGAFTISASDQWVAATISIRGGVAGIPGNGGHRRRIRVHTGMKGRP